MLLMSVTLEVLNPLKFKAVKALQFINKLFIPVTLEVLNPVALNEDKYVQLLNQLVMNTGEII